MTEYAVVGKSIPEASAIAKATGRALYGQDMNLPDMLHGKILRSPYAHARILQIDTSKAERLIGVKTVVTWHDTSGKKFIGLPTARKYLEKIADEFPFAKDKVRHIGERVAALAAIDEDTALEALDLIKVEYEELPPVFEPVEAMKEGAPRVHDEVERNLSGRIEAGYGDVEKGFRESDYVREDRFMAHILAHAPMETHNATACLDPQSGRITIWGTLQFLYWLRGELAIALDMPWDKIRTVHHHIGGGYGSREVSSVAYVAALLSKKTSKPVKVANYREEDFVTRLARTPNITTIKTGVKKDGTLVARKAELIVDIGAYRSVGFMYPRWSGYALHVPYKAQNMKYEAIMVYTNKPGFGPYRGSGMNQMFWVSELQLDMIAKELGMDPVEIRLKNIVEPNSKTPLQWEISSCGLKDCFQKATDGINWKNKKENLPEYYGIGIGGSICYSAQFFSPLPVKVSVKLNGDGTVTLMMCGNEGGSGVYSTVSQIVAEELGIRFEDVKRVIGDSDILLSEPGEHTGAHSMASGKAAYGAASKVKGDILEVVSSKLEVDAGDLEAKDGKIFVKGSPWKSVTFAEASKWAIEEKGIIEHTGEFSPKAGKEFQRVMETGIGPIADTWSFGSATARVRVDEETGKIKPIEVVSAYDCGLALNPLIAVGQILGGIAHGVGIPLFEEVIMEVGQIMNPSLLDYKTPLATEMPERMIPLIVESNDPRGPYGAKDMGIGVMFSPPSAIITAVRDALKADIYQLPLTPERILNALERSGKASSKDIG